jgi:hypothetical protein
MGDFSEAEVALGEANTIDRWDATTWGYCAVVCGRVGRWIEGEQAVTLAGKLKLRDFRLIQEILELYAGQTLGEETQIYLTALKAVVPEECHEPMEPDDAGKPTTKEEEEIPVEDEIIDDP